MKKVMSVLVILSLLFTLCVPAFAGANVDALGDAQQKEIADIVLASVEGGSDPETIMGRTAIKKAVISGIADFTAYKDAYTADPASIKPIVSAAVTAVKEDVGFSNSATSSLITLLTGAIIDVINPQEPSTTPDDDPTTDEPVLREDLQQYIDILSKLNASQLESVLVTLVANNIISVDDAKAIINELYKNHTITAAEKETLLAAIVSDDAQNNVLENIFQGYTPADLSQLFRGFGDAISTMTSALANLLRGAGGNGGNNGNNNSGSTPTNPTDIPATGDYTIPAVSAVALAAGIALVLTRKKSDKED